MTSGHSAFGFLIECRCFSCSASKQSRLEEEIQLEERALELMRICSETTAQKTFKNVPSAADCQELIWHLGQNKSTDCTAIPIQALQLTNSGPFVSSRPAHTNSGVQSGEEYQSQVRIATRGGTEQQEKESCLACLASVKTLKAAVMT